ncbi:Fc receptor-like protein 5 [Pempheris klunzingeri]|uniref:Fc receptor-like protein 5 n=1 Tax=Pempheris klunzingeri TaxID=3127111 RepID=UPI00397F1B7D
MTEGTSSYKDNFYPGDDVSCAFKGREDYRSPSVYAPRLPSVSVSPSAEIEEGSSVTLTCSSEANPAATYTWYKENQVLPVGSAGIHHFTSISSEDRGIYYCTSENQLGQLGSKPVFLDVQYAPKLPSVSVSAEIEEGSSVTLTCSSDANPAATYTWYKEDQVLPVGSAGIHHFTSIRSEDRGIYYCKSENKLGQLGSKPVFLDVQYGPRLPSVSVSPSAEIVEGSSVNLTCSSEANPAATYTWYKEDQKHISKEPQLVLTSVQSSDSGEYYCTAKNELGRRTSDCISVKVKYPPRTPSVSVSPSGEIVEGSSVTLTCSSDANPAATYTWYKEDQVLPVRSAGIHHFTSIRSEDRGIYYCKSENTLGQLGSKPVFLDVQYGPRLPSVSVSPSAEIVEGSSVTLTCSSDANPAATYTWYKEDQKHISTEPQLVLTSVQSSDSGEYYCTAENELGRRTSERISVKVKYGPRLPSVSVSPSAEIVEGSSVNLTCSSEANPAATYTWYKEDQKHVSTEPQLVLTSVQSSDSGEYYCTAENDLGTRTSERIPVKVKYPPRTPSVSVSPSGEIVEGSSVTLTCSSDANPAATYTWYKEDQTLFQAPEGSYSFTSIRSEDSGIYYCKSENKLGQLGSKPVLLDVQYGPRLPSVSVSPSAEIVEGSSVNLTCSSDANPAATYTWYKEDEDSPTASGQIFSITDFRAEHSGNYYCEAWNKIGHHNNTLHLALADTWTLAAAGTTAGTTTAVVLAVILFFVFMLVRKKRASKPSCEPGQRADSREQYHLTSQRQPEEQDDLYYASVQFSKNKPDCIYSNCRPAEEEAVEYTVVRFDKSSTAPRSQESAEEDSTALYSTINKTC